MAHQAPAAIQVVHGAVRAHRSGAQPDIHVSGPRIYFPHQWDLRNFLVLVILVDAYRIHPDGDRAKASSYLQKCGMAVRRDGNIGAVRETGDMLDGIEMFCPDVGQRRVRGRVLQMKDAEAASQGHVDDSTVLVSFQCFKVDEPDCSGGIGNRESRVEVAVGVRLLPIMMRLEGVLGHIKPPDVDDYVVCRRVHPKASPSLGSIFGLNVICQGFPRPGCHH